MSKLVSAYDQKPRRPPNPELLPIQEPEGSMHENRESQCHPYAANQQPARKNDIAAEIKRRY